MVHMCMIYVGLLNVVEGVRVMLLMMEFMHSKLPLNLCFCYVLEILIGHFFVKGDNQCLVNQLDQLVS
jgi:hypothetical protein